MQRDELTISGFAEALVRIHTTRLYDNPQDAQEADFQPVILA